MIEPIGSVAEHHVSIISTYRETAQGGRFEPEVLAIEGQGELSPMKARVLAALIIATADEIDRRKAAAR